MVFYHKPLQVFDKITQICVYMTHFIYNLYFQEKQKMLNASFYVCHIKSIKSWLKEYTGSQTVQVQKLKKTNYIQFNNDMMIILMLTGQRRQKDVKLFNQRL